MGATEDFAAAVTCRGVPVVAPEAGEHTVTPAVAEEHTVTPPTVRLRGVLKTVPPESQACTTTLCVPDPTARLTSRLAADVR